MLFSPYRNRKNCWFLINMLLIKMFVTLVIKKCDFIGDF